MTLSRDPVVTFLGSQNKNIIDLNDSDMEMLNLDLLDYVEKDDGYPVFSSPSNSGLKFMSMAEQILLDHLTLIIN